MSNRTDTFFQKKPALIFSFFILIQTYSCGDVSFQAIYSESKKTQVQIEAESSKQIISNSENSKIIEDEDNSEEISKDHETQVNIENSSIEQTGSTLEEPTDSAEDNFSDIKIIINSEKKFTNKKDVNITLTSSDAKFFYLSNSENCNGFVEWIPFEKKENNSLSLPWVLKKLNATSNLSVIFKAKSGAVSECIKSSIIHDDISPILTSFKINDGSFVTSDSTANLSFSAKNDATKMVMSTNAKDCNSSEEWFDYSDTYQNYNLGSTKGLKKIFVKISDHAGNHSECINREVMYDPDLPKSISMDIYEGLYTNKSLIHLRFEALNVSRIFITENEAHCHAPPEITSTSWQPFSGAEDETFEWNLKTPIEGSESIVFARFADSLGRKSEHCISDQVTFDSTPPTPESIEIQEGLFSKSSNIHLEAKANEASHVHLSNTVADCSPTPPTLTWLSLPLASDYTWSLTPGDGSKTIYARFKDEAGNISTCINSSITIDNTPPLDPNITFESGIEITNKTSITAEITSENDTFYYFGTATCSDDFPNLSTGSDTISSISLTENNLNTFYARSIDKAGNLSPNCVSATIKQDSEPPVLETFTVNDSESYIGRLLSVTLSITASGNPVKMKVSEAMNCADADWEDYTESKPYLLTENQEKKVYLQLKDAQENASDCSEKFVSLTNDLIPPIAEFSGQPENNTYTGNLDITVSGLDVVNYKYAYITGDSLCSTASYSSSIPISTKITDKTGEEGVKKICIKGIDLAENIQTTASEYTWEQGGIGGFTRITSDQSGLSYGYYIMTYEASLASGSFDADSITSDESKIKECTYKFHSKENSFDNTCSNNISVKSNAIPKSLEAAIPITNVSWDQAYTACRNMSDENFIVRLPTYEEWYRASTWKGSYASVWNISTAQCKTNTLPVDKTGQKPSCKSKYGIFDLAGNVSEWVDNRMKSYDINANGEGRFSYGPSIGKTIENGIDNISRRFHLVDPGSSLLALSMGANTTNAINDRKQYGANVQTWLDSSTKANNIGFRCVAFHREHAPSMSDLVLPSEPVYSESDLPDDPTNWDIPENLYVKDTNIEKVKITINGNVTDNIAEGEISLKWKPWNKKICNNAECSSMTTNDNFQYEIYRIIEPDKMSIRLSPSWSITENLELNPLNSHFSSYLIKTIDSCSSSNSSACTFTDSMTQTNDSGESNGFSPYELYRYFIVAVDPNGNKMPAMSQRFRSPYFAGEPINSDASSFRNELRSRLAGVFLVDDQFQQGTGHKKIMVHVPMDKSGLDHDFYIFKYEASKKSSSSIAVDSNNSFFPIGFNKSDSTWSSNAAKCWDTILQTNEWTHGTPYADTCGFLRASNQAGILESQKGVHGFFEGFYQGMGWGACLNTTISTASHKYHLNLASGSEWLKAADWGDVNFDGIIDQHIDNSFIGRTAAILEVSTGSLANDVNFPYCHTDGAPSTAYKSNDDRTKLCRSRYGVADMIGNREEWTTDRHYQGIGIDNGIDGLLLGKKFKYPSADGVSPTSGFNLFSALLSENPLFGVDITGALNSDTYTIAENTEIQGILRGGAMTHLDKAGRWTIQSKNSNILRTGSFNRYSVRCVLGR